MKKLLHVIATPRADDSRTLKVSLAFIEEFKKSHKDWSVEEINLFERDLPELTAKRVNGKYVLLGGKDLPDEFKGPWNAIVEEIKTFMSADIYLISSPMWNFGIPYRLKQYIDVILQPSYLFRYTAAGPEGLVKGKKMVIVTSRGGDYSSGAMKTYDLQAPYLKTVFSFVGISDIKFINAEPMDALGADIQKKKIAEAQLAARKLAESI